MKKAEMTERPAVYPATTAPGWNLCLATDHIVHQKAESASHEFAQRLI